MGWQLKILAFVVALVAIPFGAWILTVPLLIYAFSGLLPKRKKKQQVVQVVPAQYQGKNPPYAPAPHPVEPGPLGPPRSTRYSRISIVPYFVGSIFLIFGLIAAGAGGTSSPFVLGGIGLLFMLWGPFSKVARIFALKPVADSTLLRSRVPFMWVAMAEVKLATRQPARPICSIGGSLLMFASESPSIYLVLRRIAIDHRGAEEKMLERMREIAKAMAPLGAYVLPLDSGKAADRLSISLEDLRIDPEKWKQNLSTVHYDVLAIESKEGYVESFAAYVKSGRKSGGRALLPSARGKPSRQPLLWEVLHPVGTRVRWSSPDAYTAFLSSMAATENATVGERVIDMGSASDSQILHVKSVGSPTVVLSRPELRAIVKVYSPLVKIEMIQTAMEKLGIKV